jgi:hypothetical protein
MASAIALRFNYFVRGRRISESTGQSDEAEARRQLMVKVGEARRR